MCQRRARVQPTRRIPGSERTWSASDVVPACGARSRRGDDPARELPAEDRQRGNGRQITHHPEGSVDTVVADEEVGDPPRLIIRSVESGPDAVERFGEAPECKEDPYEGCDPQQHENPQPKPVHPFDARVHVGHGTSVAGFVRDALGLTVCPTSRGAPLLDAVFGGAAVWGAAGVRRGFGGLLCNRTAAPLSTAASRGARGESQAGRLCHWCCCASGRV